MKKFFTLLSIFALTTIAYAQTPTKLNITMKNGSVITYDIADIDSIWFPEAKNDTPIYEDIFSINIPQDFSENLIMKATIGELNVALICREYIKAADKVLTVAYPYSIEGEINFEKGLVIEDGGTVTWNLTDNTCTYTAGNTETLTQVFWADGTIIPTTEAFYLESEIKPDLLTDRRGSDEKTYRTVKIGTQIWMADNLNTEFYRNGTTIANIPNTNIEGWRTNTTGACHAYGNSAEYQAEYGLMYNGYAIESEAGLAPTGWDIPTVADYRALRTYLAPNAGLKMKSAEPGAWREKEGYEPTGESGFEAKAGGYYFVSGDGDMGDWTDVWYWTKTVANDYSFGYEGLLPVRLNYSIKNLYISTETEPAPHDRATYGHYVRCIKK